MQSLFEQFDEPMPQAARLVPRLKELAQRGLFFGTSSWKYEGWLGSIYSPDKYQTRKKFSRKKFESECLREYAATFPVAGGDFSFYQFPSAEFWKNLFAHVPENFGFGLKAPEEMTVLRWPGHARYGQRAGRANLHFLDAPLFKQAFLDLLEPYRQHVPVIMFEFGAFSKKDIPREEFIERLGQFLAALPTGWRYAVEIRNNDLLSPKYFATLANHNTAHVFNAWTRMPNIMEQMKISEAFTANFSAVRALLQVGQPYEDAVKTLEPYREVKQPDPDTRDALVSLAHRALSLSEPALVFVNNRLEGNAPSTIEAVVEAIKH